MEFKSAGSDGKLRVRPLSRRACKFAFCTFPGGEYRFAMTRREMLSMLPAVGALWSAPVKIPVQNPGKVHILEFTSDDMTIYGFGSVDAEGTVTVFEEETFGSFPSGGYPVLRADGSIVSHAEFEAWLDANSEPDPAAE